MCVCVCVCVALVNQPKKRMSLTYIIICGQVCLVHIFPHYRTNCTIFEKKKKLLHVMCVSIFSTNFARSISHSKKNSARFCHKYTYVFM